MIWKSNNPASSLSTVLKASGGTCTVRLQCASNGSVSSQRPCTLAVPIHKLTRQREATAPYLFISALVLGFAADGDTARRSFIKRHGPRSARLLPRRTLAVGEVPRRGRLLRPCASHAGKTGATATTLSRSCTSRTRARSIRHRDRRSIMLRKTPNAFSPIRKRCSG